MKAAARHTQGAEGFSPRGSSSGTNATQRERPRGLKPTARRNLSFRCTLLVISWFATRMNSEVH